MEKSKITIIICATAVTLLSIITYGHMLMPSDKNKPLDTKYKFEEEIDGQMFLFSYANKTTKEVTMTLEYNSSKNNLRIPSKVIHNQTTYNVIEVTSSKFGSIDCDTLFIPETIVYLDQMVFNNSYNRRINFISVDAKNSVYKSIDGNLYKGDSLLFDKNTISKE